MQRAIKKIKKTKNQFKAGYKAGRKPGRHYASRAFDTVTNVGGAFFGGPIAGAITLASTAYQAKQMGDVGSKAGRLGRKVGGKVRTAKQKLALRKAQLASARKRRKSK
jgi:hypothetical protein